MDKEVLSAYRNATRWIHTTEINEISIPNFQSRFSDILDKIDNVLRAMDEMASKEPVELMAFLVMILWFNT